MNRYALVVRNAGRTVVVGIWKDAGSAEEKATTIRRAAYDRDIEVLVVPSLHRTTNARTVIEAGARVLPPRDWFVMACPCGYYDTGDERLCPECGVGLLLRVAVAPIEEVPWSPERAMLGEATADGLFTVGDDGRFRLTEKGREVADDSLDEE